MTTETITTPTAEIATSEAAAIERGQAGLSEVTPEAVTTSSAPVRPDHIPEQFWKADGTIDTEGMAKSYAELRAKMDAPKTDATPEAPPVKPNGAIEKPATAETSTEVSPLTSAMEAARTEYATSGEVAEETIAALEAAGIPKEVFGLYMEGIKATEAKALNEIYGYAGDQETYNQISTWAAEKLTDAELEAYNSAIENPAMRENAVRGLAARYAAARPSEGRLLSPNLNLGGSSDTYADRDEFVADTKNPKYSTDSKFRAEVQEKLRRSQASGFSVVPRSMFEKQVYSNG